MIAWPYALAFAAVCCATTWACVRLTRRGGSTAPAPTDYGESALDRLPRAPSLPPPGHEELRVTVPPVPAEQRWRGLALPPAPRLDEIYPPKRKERV